jgi:hypothetical protein
MKKVLNNIYLKKNYINITVKNSNYNKYIIYNKYLYIKSIIIIKSY